MTVVAVGEDFPRWDGGMIRRGAYAQVEGGG